MSDSDEDWDMNYEEEDFSQPIHIRQKSYTIITIDEIHTKILESVTEYSEMCGISPDEALILLTFYKWKSYKLQEE